MAVGVQSETDEMITGINVTPLVDVVLVLLIIFMITAPALYQAAIKVDLPKASSGEKAEHVTLRFTMMPSGEIRLGSDVVAAEKVPDLVRQALSQDPSADAVIGADRNLSHGTVMAFIDTLKTNGLTRFAVGVQSPDGGKASRKGRN